MANCKKRPDPGLGRFRSADEVGKDVVAGRIVTKLMRLAAERHLRDEERTDIIWRKDKPADALEWT